MNDRTDDKTREELEEQDGELLPNRENMSVIRDPSGTLDPFPGDMPVDPPAEPTRDLPPVGE